MHRKIWAATIAVVTALGAPASADEAAKRAIEKLDGDAPIVVVVRPRGPKAVLDWLRTFGGAVRPFIDEGLREVFGSFEARTGVNPADPKTWSESGLDLDAPIAAGLAAVDAALAEKAFQSLTTGKRDPKKDAKIARPWLRSRVAAKLADEAKFKALIDAIATASQGEIAIVGTADAQAIATAMEAEAKQGAAISKALAKAKIYAVARDGDRFYALRIDGGYAIVDALFAFGGDAIPFQWKRDGAALLKLATRSVGKGRADLLDKGAGRMLGDADIGVWLEPNGILDASKAMGWSNVLNAVDDAPDGQRAALIAQGAEEVRMCDEFRPLARTGAFEDAAFTFRAAPGSFEWSGGYGLRKAYALASALVAANDGLVDLGATTDAVAIGVVYLNGLAPIRALPRPGVLGKSMGEIGQAAWMCGGGGTTVGVAFGWPQLLGAAIDEQAQHDAELRSIVDNVRNFAVALRNVSDNLESMSGVAVASFVDSPDLAWILEQLSKKPQTITVGKRAVTFYPAKSRWEPAFVRAPLDAGKIAWGAVYGGQSAVKWFWGKAGGSTAGANAIALGRANLPMILAQLGRAQSYLAPYLDEIAKRVGTIAGKMSIDDEVLTSTIKLEIR